MACDSPPPRIGLLGGVFNPIHRGHLAIAEEARRALELDRVIFIPSGNPPHKPGGALAPARQRLAMTECAVAGVPHFAVSAVEINTAGPSYTIETVRALRAAMAGEFWFIIGLDAFLQTAGWKSAEALVSSTNFLVLSRPPAQFAQAASLAFLPSPPAGQLQRLDTGTCRRLDIPTGPRAALTLLRMPPCPVSASAIHARIRQGMDIAGWLPPPVHSYIIRHRLYGLR